MDQTILDIIIRGKDELTKVAKDAGNNLSSLGKTAEHVAVGSTLALGAIGVVSVKMAADFQEGMTTLVTGAGESEDNMKLVSNGILKLATSTGTSTKQLTDGMFMIESAGYHGKAGLDVLKAAAQGAKVGNADLGTVADATTTILKDFGSTGITASGAVNTLIATVANGKTHMGDLAMSLSQVLPTASAAKIGLNDVMGAMATMTGEGVPAADAATYLRQTMIALSAPSAGTTKALNAVGLSTKQVSDEMHKSLPGTIRMITDAVGKKFPAGSVGYISALKAISGGSKQMQGVLDLSGSHLKDFQANVKTVGTSVSSSKDEIKGWKETQSDFNVKMAQAGQVLNTTAIAIGSALLPPLTTLVGAVVSIGTPLANWVTTHRTLAASIAISVTAFVSLVAVILAMHAAFVKVKAAISIVQLGIAAFTKGGMIANVATKAWTAAQVVFNAVMDANPIALVIIAIAALIAITIVVITHWKQVSSFFSTLWTDVMNLFNSRIGIILSVLFPFIGIPLLVMSHWQQIAGFFGWLWTNVTGGIGNFVGGAVGFFSRLPGQIMGALGNAGGMLYNAGKNIIQGLIRGITDIAGGVRNAVANVANGAVDQFKKILGIHSPSTVFAEAGKNIGQGLVIGLNGTKSAVQNATSGLVGTAGSGKMSVNAVLETSGSASMPATNSTTPQQNAGVTFNAGGITVNIGMYAGTQSEKQKVATEIWQSLMQVARSHNMAGNVPNLGIRTL